MLDITLHRTEGDIPKQIEEFKLEMIGKVEMPEYDGNLFNPPAPIAYVILLDPENNLDKIISHRYSNE